MHRHQALQRFQATRPALVRLFERELGPDGVVGQQLDSAVTPLLKVAEFSPHEERGWWMRLCCIGRVEASDVERSAHGYDTASICPYRDEEDRVNDDEAKHWSPFSFVNAYAWVGAHDIS